MFGYAVEDLSAPGFTYASLSLDGQPVAGVGGYGAQAGTDAPAAWTIYFAVTDIDAAAARVAELGGTVVSPPTDSAFGRMAIVAGPFGEVFALIAPSPAPEPEVRRLAVLVRPPQASRRRRPLPQASRRLRGCDRTTTTAPLACT